MLSLNSCPCQAAICTAEYHRLLPTGYRLLRKVDHKIVAYARFYSHLWYRQSLESLSKLTNVYLVENSSLNMMVNYRVNKILRFKTALRQFSPVSYPFNIGSSWIGNRHGATRRQIVLINLLRVIEFWNTRWQCLQRNQGECPINTVQNLTDNSTEHLTFNVWNWTCVCPEVFFVVKGPAVDARDAPQR